MKKYSKIYPLIFGIVMLLIGIIAQQYIIVVIFGMLPIILSLFLFILEKDKKRSSKLNETNESTISTVSTVLYSRPHKKDGYIFNIDPEKYKDCQNFIANLNQLLQLDSKYNVFYHYIAIGKNDGQPYEVHTKVVGFVGEYTHTKAVEDFVNPPRKITFDEFLKLVDCKYPSISVLYEGINENNWELYLNVLNHWNKIPVEKKPIKKEDIDPSRVRYEFKQSYDERRKWIHNHPHRYPLVSISEFLFTKGFNFIRASVGGGVDEISHTGDVAYSAEYTKFEDFRDNFDIDLEQAEQNSPYNGWGISLNYGYIVVDLAMDELSVKVMVDDTKVVITWFNLKEEDSVLIEAVNERMKKILVGDVILTREIFLK